jgi:hypothetical protein
VVSDEELSAAHIMPIVFHADVHYIVAFLRAPSGGRAQ